MDLAWLEAFVTVARFRSFTQAAAHLHLTQPGVSRQIQKLEREFGVTLMERASGGIRLTSEGELVARFAEDVLGLHRQLLRDLQPEEAQLAGELRIAASSTPGEFLVPGLVAGFMEEHPKLKPEVFIADSAAVVEEVLTHRWEVGFIGARFPQTNLSHAPVVEDEVVLAVPAGHPFALREAIALEELEGQPFLEREGGSGTLLSVQRSLNERGLQLPAYRTVMILSTSQAIISAVENGYGIGWVSSLALERRRTDRVAFVRLAGLPFKRVLFMIYDPHAHRSPEADAFIDWTLAGAASHPAPE